MDLFILEELHSDTGFSDWLTKQLDLDGYVFRRAEHSVSTKAGAKWGETDVLAFFSGGDDQIALLIEDKISANFADRQAQRYHERARDLVQRGDADRHLTVLVAPQSYLAGVPADEPWDRRVSIESLRDWFAGRKDAHAYWRETALTNCLTRLRPIRSPGSEDVVRFSAELSTYLERHHNPILSHKPGKDTLGPTIRFPGSNEYKTLWWKVGTNQMVLQLMDPLAGHMAHLKAPERIGMEIAGNFGRKCDYLVIDVPSVDFSTALEDQQEAVEAAISAAYRLIAFLPEIEAAANHARPASTTA